MEKQNPKAILSVELLEDNTTTCAIGGGSVREKMHLVTTLISALLSTGFPQLLLDIAVKAGVEKREVFDRNVKQQITMPMPKYRQPNKEDT